MQRETMKEIVESRLGSQEYKRGMIAGAALMAKATNAIILSAVKSGASERNAVFVLNEVANEMLRYLGHRAEAEKNGSL